MSTLYLEDKFKQALHSNDICEHVPTLRFYASKCQAVTEFGVRDGYSTIGLLSGYPQVMTSYDISSPGPFLELERTIKEAAACGITYKFIQQDVLVLPEIAPTDLLFIDTLHTYAQLSYELAVFSKSVRSYIIMHDTVSFAYRDEVRIPVGKAGLLPAIEDFVKTNPWKIESDYANCNGLMILTRN